MTTNPDVNTTLCDQVRWRRLGGRDGSGAALEDRAPDIPGEATEVRRGVRSHCPGRMG
jgi:hypothetical protein